MKEAIPGRLNLSLLAGVGASCAGALWLASHGTLLQTIIAVIAFSFLNNTMFALLHESVHDIGHPNRRINEMSGRIAAAFFPTSLTLQRIFHLAHHARNRTVEEQFDYIRPFDRPLLKYAQWYAIVTGLYWLFVPIGAITFFVAPSLFTQPLLRSRSSAVAVQTGAASMFASIGKAPVALIRAELLLTLAIQLTLFFALDLSFGKWLLCYAAFAVNWSSLQYADHAFSPLDVREGAWNLRVNPLTRLLFLNYHHHLAHHRNPQIPWLHLGRHIDANEERPYFWKIYLKMWRGPRPISEAQ